MENNLPFIETVYTDKHRFQQDNDPKHHSKLAQQFMKDNDINWWNVWPSESPDLNPIEMVWNMLKRRLAKQNLTTKDELVKAVKQFWETELTVNMQIVISLFKQKKPFIVANYKAN